MTKITYLQALIDSSMPAKLKKGNETPKKFALTLNPTHQPRNYQVLKTTINAFLVFFEEKIHFLNRL